ncbi:MAG: dNTP triphosphohydrolase [Chitinophagales bacterium]|nr:dNTP triphosphohydrolase [Chitinophagales bacterium]
MDINLIYSDKRSEQYTPQHGIGARNEFLRDFDRIIFSSAFRRLQNKTQVFPLPGSVFVHNRLTHSLEVSSVGRTLGNDIGDYICQKFETHLTRESREFYKYNLYHVISSACLCHDIGNPAFGHSGEDAIVTFFKKNADGLKPYFSEKEWSDLINFEGNANAIRLLTQQQTGKSHGGLLLTYTTLASIAKYPCESTAKDKKFLHRKKFGFFQSEKNTFIDIAKNTQMLQVSDEPVVFQRHPFVWLVEAADDICYNIIDLEDAHRLGIVSHIECYEVFMDLLSSIAAVEIDKINAKVNGIKDKNDKIAYLRAKSIQYLTILCIEAFKDFQENIFSGRQTVSLFKSVCQQYSAVDKIEAFSIENIYNHRSVLEIENAGYNVMYELLTHFVFPIIKPKGERAIYEKKAVLLIPKQFLYEDENVYQRVLGVLDFVSGMTDNFATDLYRKIKGIDIGMTM